MGNQVPLLTPLIRNGKIVRRFLSIDELKERTKSLVKRASKLEPKIIL
jgi:hypothetical protein